MERLTQFDGDGVGCNPKYDRYDDPELLKKVYDKLCVLEELESHLEIELRIAIAALLYPIYYREEQGDKFTGKILALDTGGPYLRVLDAKLQGIAIYNNSTSNIKLEDFFFFDEYGVTWALTKEELEKKK